MLPASSLLRAGRVFALPSRSHTGYIPFEGRLGRVPISDEDRFNVETSKFNLQPVKHVHFKLDPFRENVKSTRYMMNRLSFRKVRASNIKTTFKTEILSDGSDPLIKVELNDGRLVTFKAGTLTPYDVAFHFNRIILPLVKTESSDEVTTKGAKKKKK